jgi:pimeloyl-ACP methyl ester carboxylesterase
MGEVFHSNSRELVYSRTGSGDHRLLFLHGLCGTKELWVKQAAFFSSDFEIVCPDLLGHGESSAINGRALIGENVEMLSAFAKQHPKPTTLIGHSLGGIMVNDLIGADASFRNYVFVDSPCLALDQKRIQYNSYYDVILAKKDPRAFFKEWYDDFLTEKSTQVIRDIVVGEAMRREPQWMADVMGGLVSPQKRGVDPSTLFVIEGSQYYGSDKSTSWLQLYPAARRWQYPGRGHFFFLEDPVLFNEVLAEFLNSKM